MKKIKILLVLLSLVLVACRKEKAEEVKETTTGVVQESTEFVKKLGELLSFKSADGEIFNLSSKDLFETAILKITDGSEINLKREASESGIKLVGENGTEFNFTENEGVLNLNGKEYRLNLLEEVVENVSATVNKIAEILTFKSADGKTFDLSSDDLFETAILKTADGSEINLKRETSENGVKLVGENGTEFNFNENEGILNLNGKEYHLNLFEETKETFKNIFKNIAGNAANGVKEAASDVKASVENILNQNKEETVAINDDTKEKAKETKSNITQPVKKKKSTNTAKKDSKNVAVATNSSLPVVETPDLSKAEIIIFKTPAGNIYRLETLDLFETATLQKPNGEIVNLKNTASGVGTKLVGENGVEVYFNNDDGHLNINGREFLFKK